MKTVSTQPKHGREEKLEPSPTMNRFEYTSSIIQDYQRFKVKIKIVKVSINVVCIRVNQRIYVKVSIKCQRTQVKVSLKVTSILVKVSLKVADKLIKVSMKVKVTPVKVSRKVTVIPVKVSMKVVINQGISTMCVTVSHGVMCHVSRVTWRRTVSQGRRIYQEYTKYCISILHQYIASVSSITDRNQEIKVSLYHDITKQRECITNHCITVR